MKDLIPKDVQPAEQPRNQVGLVLGRRPTGGFTFDLVAYALCVPLFPTRVVQVLVVKERLDVGLEVRISEDPLKGSWVETGHTVREVFDVPKLAGSSQTVLGLTVQGVQRDPEKDEPGVQVRTSLQPMRRDEEKNAVEVVKKTGAGGGSRTRDLLITKASRHSSRFTHLRVTG